MKKSNIFLISGIVVLFASLLFSVWFFLLRPSTDQSTVPTSDIRIGFSLGDLREERWQKDRDLFVAAAKKLGAYVQVASANSDADLQNTQIENMISQGMDIIVIVPYDSEKVKTAVDAAHKANIKLLSYDRLIRGANVDFYITFDNAQVGKLQAQGVTAVQNKGNFAYIGGAPTDNNASLLKKGSMEVLSPLIKDGSIKLVIDKLTEGWKPEEAYKTIKEYLSKGGKLDAVVAANDGTAFGVIRALKEHGLEGKVPVSGQDAELSACQRVVAGTQTVTVYKPLNLIAEKAAEIAVSMARGGIPTSNNKTNDGNIDVPSLYLEPILVTRENIDEIIIKGGFYTKAQVYQKIK